MNNDEVHLFHLVGSIHVVRSAGPYGLSDVFDVVGPSTDVNTLRYSGYVDPYDGSGAAGLSTGFDMSMSSAGVHSATQQFALEHDTQQ
ncbi:ankyrin repeat and death domain-containing protein 1A [Dorcoceras hygrometricum]|uniref:Ankyrin repeat and death domain-containing protein 1A n=1 Tax=Dorcoceras hygrometricum TaxID=472368 RepID=A0A2Z7CCV3_9LAMI|nr:ankyrin repeat and death domain-containing protein 1A [Dorcoceras hygrometricum]